MIFKVIHLFFNLNHAPSNIHWTAEISAKAEVSNAGVPNTLALVDRAADGVGMLRDILH